MSSSITGLNNSQLGYFNQLTSNRAITRIKFVDDGTQIAYDSAVTVAADTTLRSDLSSDTVSELKDKCTAPGNFQFAEERSIYRYAGGTAADTITIPLAKVNKACIVGAYAVITADFGGTQSFSVGIPGNTDFILGATVGTDLSIPSGSETSLWTQSYPFATGTPDAGASADGRIYYAPDRMLAPGTPINLYITAGTSVTLGTGDVTIEFLATALGQETFGIVDGNNSRKSISGGPGDMYGRDQGPIYPAF